MIVQHKKWKRDFLDVKVLWWGMNAGKFIKIVYFDISMLHIIYTALK